MSLCVIAMPGAERCAVQMAQQLGAARIELESRRFPDGEIYLRVAADVQGCDVAVVAQLRDPDPQIPALLFAADALRELGAASVGLVAPYLPYMRQDMRFRAGEAVTSLSFAKLVSKAFSWLVTVDPHLHRHASLDAIYAIPNVVVPSAPAIAAWVQTQVKKPYLLGPDAESEQWVSEVARLAACPHGVFRKHRHGDRDVDVAAPDLQALQGHTPVLVDDIISSAHTMAEAAHRLREMGFDAPVCIGVHAVFAGDAVDVLQASGAGRVVTCNTLPHPSNAIDVTAALAEAVRMMLADPRTADRVTPAATR